MPLKYIIHIRETRRQLYEELIYKNQLKELLKHFKEQLFWIKDETRKFDNLVLTDTEIDKVVKITSRNLKESLIREQTRLIKNIKEVELEITYSNNRLWYFNK